jgi:hypothetical protein
MTLPQEQISTAGGITSNFIPLTVPVRGMSLYTPRRIEGADCLRRASIRAEKSSVVPRFSRSATIGRAARCHREEHGDEAILRIHSLTRDFAHAIGLDPNAAAFVAMTGAGDGGPSAV